MHKDSNMTRQGTACLLLPEGSIFLSPQKRADGLSKLAADVVKGLNGIGKVFDSCTSVITMDS